MPKPGTPAQQEAARQNGAKSKGPITRSGKQISARNRYTHGLLTKTVVIEGEESARFATLLHSLRHDLQPATALEESLVEDLAINRWRQCLLAMETASYTTEIRRQIPQPDLETTPAQTNAVRAAQALIANPQTNRTLDLINRYELRFSRQFNRTLNRLLNLQTVRKTKIDHSNPGTP